MPAGYSGVEINNFVGGLVTEASPLNFPPNASVDEQNFNLHKDGSRTRRLGICSVSGTEPIKFNKVSGAEGLTTYRWESAGGMKDKDFLVVQLYSQLSVIDSNTKIELWKYPLENWVRGVDIGITSVDGILVVTTGSKDITVIEYNGTFTVSKMRLKIRDLYGVEDLYDSEDLRVGMGILKRPRTLSQQHEYNLRNQTFGIPRMNRLNETMHDPIHSFYEEYKSTVGGDPSDRTPHYPSNSDTVTQALHPNTDASLGKDIDRFFPRSLISNPIGTFPAPQGYFVIDALDRGASRLAEVRKLGEEYHELKIGVSALPLDSTKGGATVVETYSGRVFYAGFEGEVIDGDKHSPNLTNHIMFSRLVRDKTDVYQCYQKQDPTSKDAPDLLDTDGGILKVDGAVGIVSLKSLHNGLAIIAKNGVWLLRGGSDEGFKTTSYEVTKISGFGCLYPSSVVGVDTSMLYWSEVGIISIAQDQFGQYKAENVSEATVQTLYNNYISKNPSNVVGVFDSYEKKVRWIVSGISSTHSEELVLDHSLGSFSKNIYSTISTNIPRIAGVINVPFYRVDSKVSGLSYSSETNYLTILREDGGGVEITFASNTREDYLDWVCHDGVGKDARAFAVSGFITGGDSQRMKQATYMTMFFNKTETGFNSEWEPLNTSSCVTQIQWEWTNSEKAGKWGRPFQAYRHRRAFIPESSKDFDDGYRVVSTKNRLRGRGRSLSVKVESEPKKHMHFLGWSLMIGTNSNV